MTQIPLIKTALLYAPVETFNLRQGPVALALDLCSRHGWGLTAMALHTDTALAVSPDARTHVQLEKDSADLAERNATNIAGLQGACSVRQIDLAAVTTIDHSRGFFPFVNDHARLHDLVICGTDAAGMLSERIVVEGLLFDAGRPVLLVPHERERGYGARHIAVAWDNSRNAARALGDALALLPEVEQVTFVVVGNEKAIACSLSEDWQVKALTRRKLSVMVRHTDRGHHPVGLELQKSAMEVGADLLAMGAYGHSRLRQFILGGATLDVLANLQLPVLMSH